MSADYGTARYKGYGHRHPRTSDHVAYIHVVEKGTGGEFSGGTVGDFSLAEITELAQLAGQAWPRKAGVEVRYVIEARRHSKQEWQPMWSAVADDEDGDMGVSEDFAAETFKGFVNSKLEWRLVRRTILTADETIEPEGTTS